MNHGCGTPHDQGSATNSRKIHTIAALGWSDLSDQASRHHHQRHDFSFCDVDSLHLSNLSTCQTDGLGIASSTTKHVLCLAQCCGSCWVQQGITAYDKASKASSCTFAYEDSDPYAFPASGVLPIVAVIPIPFHNLKFKAHLPSQQLQSLDLLQACEWGPNEQGAKCGHLQSGKCRQCLPGHWRSTQRCTNQDSSAHGSA